MGDMTDFGRHPGWNLVNAPSSTVELFYWPALDIFDRREQGGFDLAGFALSAAAFLEKAPHLLIQLNSRDHLKAKNGKIFVKRENFNDLFAFHESKGCAVCV